MNHFTTAASVLTAIALTMPMVCRAQDPLSSLKRVTELAGAGQKDEAIQLCDAVLTKFGGNSTVAKQFNYVLPFYAWEKASIYFKAKEYDKAYEAFKAFHDDARFKDPALLAAAKANIPSQAEGFAPYLTNCIFQMGYCRYMQGVGTDDKPGDPKMFNECIAHLEEYLGLLKKNKVSAVEKKQKIDGQICFLLLQAYILKPEPDFKKASDYLDMGRKAKSRVPDEMAMSGLNSIVSVAMKDPKTIGWVSRVIDSSPASYRLEPVRAARAADKFFNFGLKAFKAAETATQKDDMVSAAEAARTANTLFGLVPDVYEVRADLAAQIKMLGKYKGNMVDKGLAYSYTGDKQRKLAERYKQFADDNMDLECFALLGTANTNLAMGSNRLAKGGFKVLYDRYPKFSTKSKDGKMKPMRDTFILQLSQLSYNTGNEDDGAKYGALIEDSEELPDQKKVVAFNKMRRLLKEEKWDEVIPVAKQVMESYKGDPSNKFYLSGQFTELAAYYKKKDYENVLKSGEALLKGGNLRAGRGKNAMKESEVNTYECQAFFFMIDACSKLGENDKAQEVFKDYAAKHTTTDLKENPLAPNMYFTAGECLMRQASVAEGTTKSEYQDKALQKFRFITANWKENAYYPSAELQIASVLINRDKDEEKQEAINLFEKCAEAALKNKEDKTDSSRRIASNALYCLASYAHEVEMPNEDEAARMARSKTYMARYWDEADYEGNPFSLDALSLTMQRVDSPETFKAAMERARTIIPREANYALSQNLSNPDLERTIYDYVAAYTDGMKKYEEKQLTLAEKTEHFTNFPGIKKEDKYTNAIFRMAQIDAMNKELKQLEYKSDAYNTLSNDIESTFRSMTNTFKPEDLTNFICVNVGDYLVKYIGGFADPSSKTAEIDQAVSYYDAVLNRKADMVAEATLGKANALAFSKDDAKRKVASEMYDKVSASQDPAIYGPALLGLAQLHMRAGNPSAAVTAASKFIEDRGLRSHPERLRVMLLLGEAYRKSGDDKNALLTYMNLYGQNRGNILYSAPACKAMMEILWSRNTPAQGDRMKGTFKASDRWTAWNTGQNYVTLIKNSGIDKKMTGDERDEFNKVVADVTKYASDGAVQQEDKANKDFKNKVKSTKK